jgi:hypothetical protein
MFFGIKGVPEQLYVEVAPEEGRDISPTTTMTRFADLVK